MLWAMKTEAAFVVSLWHRADSAVDYVFVIHIELDFRAAMRRRRLRHFAGQKRPRVHPHRYQDDPGLPRPQVDPAYGAVHRAGTDSVQKLIPGLTAPASFEATVGASSCPRLAELFKKSRGMFDGSLFALKYLPPLMRR